MQTTDIRIGLPVAVAIALLVAASGGAAEASGITARIGYSTTGVVEPATNEGLFGETGTQVISFQGVSEGTLTTGGTPFVLGRILVASLPDGASTTYNGTLLNVTLTPESVNGTAILEAKPIVLEGNLWGTITGSDTSNLRVYFPGYPVPAWNPPVNSYPSIIPPFAIGGLTNYLNLTSEDSSNPSAFGIGNVTSLQATMISVQTAPEPSTLAIFSCMVGLLVQRYSRRRRYKY